MAILIAATVATSFVVGSIMLLQGFIDKSSPIELIVLILMMILFLVGLEMVVLGVAWAQYAEPYSSERTLEYGYRISAQERWAEEFSSIDVARVHGVIAGVGLEEATLKRHRGGQHPPPPELPG
ncbi:MAG: hypothetical protein Q9207_006009 [Kuettlingeria erythrocarpa]